MKVVAFAASSSRNSINKLLVAYAASLLEYGETEILEINDFELPLFSAVSYTHLTLTTKLLV